MTPQDATIANADIWTRYFQQQWSAWLNPLGVRAASPVAEVAEGTAARIATFLTLVAAGPIAWMYSANALRVTQVVGDGQRAEERPVAVLEGSAA